MVRKALGLMEIGPREATQGELGELHLYAPDKNRGGSRKKIVGGSWSLIIWEATTAKQNYYRTNYINQ